MRNTTDAKREAFLVLRAQAGDREAFDELLLDVQEPLFRYISRLVGESFLAEDVLQEVFILIYRKIGWLEDPSLFRPWAYRIASREAFRRLKKEKRWAEQVRDEEIMASFAAALPEEKYEPELIARVPELISRVSPASRAVLILHYLEEMPLTATAEVLDISLGTAKSRLAYGLESLRRKIRDEI